MLREWGNRRPALVSDHFVDTSLCADQFYIFDSSYGWSHNDNENTAFYDEEGYLHKRWIFEPDSLTNEDDEFIYRINSEHFRTNHFKKVESPVVLFSGCSITSGAGLHEDFMWASRFMQKPGLENYEFYNLAVNGGSIKTVLHNFRVFVDKYGAPEYFLALVPDFERSIIYHDDADVMVKVSQIPPTHPAFKQPWIKRFMTQMSVEDLIFDSVTSMLMLETLCNALGTKLIWSTWDEKSAALCQKIKFKNFVNIPTRTELDSADIPNTLNYKHWDIARDNQHPGGKFNYGMANAFYQHFLEVNNV
jgi:hypothetical protein